jgi:hypothetical protein
MKLPHFRPRRWNDPDRERKTKQIVQIGLNACLAPDQELIVLGLKRLIGKATNEGPDHPRSVIRRDHADL